MIAHVHSTLQRVLSQIQLPVTLLIYEAAPSDAPSCGCERQNSSMLRMAGSAALGSSL